MRAHDRSPPASVHASADPLGHPSLARVRWAERPLQGAGLGHVGTVGRAGACWQVANDTGVSTYSRPGSQLSLRARMVHASSASAQSPYIAGDFGRPRQCPGSSRQGVGDRAGRRVRLIGADSGIAVMHLRAERPPVWESFGRGCSRLYLGRLDSWVGGQTRVTLRRNQRRCSLSRKRSEPGRSRPSRRHRRG